MRKYNIFRIACIAILWVILCVLVIRAQGFNGPSLLTVVMSGAIVFVPLHKRWKKESEEKENSQNKSKRKSKRNSK